jgi:ATP-dependent protease ClpP protease subunit
MVGNTIEIAEGGFVMIHNARMVAAGEAKDLRQAADILETVNGTIRDTYVARTRQSADQVTAWMDAETWFTGSEAVKHGFADKIVENLQAAAAITDPSKFRNLPAALRPNRARAAGALAAIAGAKKLLPV